MLGTYFLIFWSELMLSTLVRRRIFQREKAQAYVSQLSRVQSQKVRPILKSLEQMFRSVSLALARLCLLMHVLVAPSIGFSLGT